MIEVGRLHLIADGPEQALDRLDRRDGAVLAAILLAFVASRILWLATAPASSIYWEETYRWIAANELLHRPFHSLVTYQADPYQGGSLVIILLATGLMKLFGQTALVMKMTAVLYSSVTLTVLYVLARKAFDRSTAIVASAGYLAGPPVAAYWGLTLMGSHSESVLPSLVLILLAMRLLWSQTRTHATWGALGLTAGLGLWFCYTTGLTLVACALVWVALRGFPRPRELAAAVLGGVAGMLPWLAYNIHEGFTGLERLAQMFGYGQPLDLWVPQTVAQKLWLLGVRDIPAGATLLFNAPLLTAPTVIALAVAFAVPLHLGVLVSLLRVALIVARADPVASAPRVARDATLRAREAFFIVYLGVFTGFLCVSRFSSSGAAPVDFRLYVPPLVLALVPCAAGVVRAVRRVGARAPGVVAGEPALPVVGRLGALPVYRPLRAIVVGSLAVAHLVASTVATVSFAAGHAGANIWLENLTGYQMQGVLLHVKYRPDRLDRADSIAREIDDPTARFRTFIGIGWGLALGYRASGDFDLITAYVEGHSEEEKMALFQGMRWVAETMLKSLDSGADPVSSTPLLADEARKRMETLHTRAADQIASLPQRFRFVSAIPTTLPGRFIEPRNRK